jgi:hemerythrin-like domain-containing protein
MKPIGPLMIEHRTIEKMVALLGAELQRIVKRGEPDPVLIYTAVDFFRTYADRTHHGKEEDILFKELEKKPLKPDEKRIMKELVEEHVIARQTVRALNEATANYANGDRENLKTIIENLKALVELYPKHIKKEDKGFFYPVQEYFSPIEQETMLQAFGEFDRNMIHEKYKKVVEEMQARQTKSLA